MSASSSLYAVGNSELIALLKDIEIEKKSLQHQLEKGIISEVDAVMFFDMNKKKELTLKIKLVEQVHLTATGRKAKISQGKPTSCYPGGFWYTRLKGGETLKAKTHDDLILKLYQVYFGDENRNIFTVADIFEKAIEEKQATENPKAETILRSRYEFARYFSDDFLKKDITSINESDLKAYTQNLVSSQEMTSKRFLSYKGVLNLIFEYAVAHEIIKTNPVNKIKNATYLKSCVGSDNDSDTKILTEAEIQALIDETKQRAEKGYYVYYYALRFSALTGVRIGELCSLKWSDIDYENYTIHIHTQQLAEFTNGHYRYYIVPYTKNERGQSKGGRYFPLTDEILSLLTELKTVLKKEGIKSEYVFCHANGEWMNTMSYKSFFGKLARKHKLNATSNHALRRSLNSNVLIPMGMSVADRAKLLGHSVETNLKHYSFAQRDYVDSARDLLNKSQKNEKSHNYYVAFPGHEKNPQTANL